MKKLLFLHGSTLLLLLFLLFGVLDTNPERASAHRTASVPVANPYCQLYLQNLASRLNISVAALEQNKLAAEEDVLIHLVKDGKLLQAQADQFKAKAIANAARAVCD